ncbi:MAG TPA: YdeI/OmpD-associated family protein [Polyangia bacterium]|nr:YdeI/OmpD-associated family protein [Polyangia bacterium]
MSPLLLIAPSRHLPPLECPRAPERRLPGGCGPWRFFEAQPPGYRKLVSWWILSAKKEETRLNRLKKLIAESARGRRL